MSTLSQPTITREVISPEVAAQLLERNTRNRTPSEYHIKKLEAVMKSGNFHFTGDPIRIAVDGTLLDGQHRLTACVRAEMAFDTVVIRNLPDEAIIAIDGGKARTVQQQIEIACGINAFTTSTTLMLCRMSLGPKYNMVPADTIAAIMAKHHVIATTAETYRECAKFGLGANLPAGELILRAGGFQDEANAYREVWLHGTQSPLAEAAATLRERLILVTEPETSSAKKRQWRNTFRRMQLEQTIQRIAEGVRAPKTVLPGNILFPMVTPERLLQFVDFTRDDKPNFNEFSTVSPKARNKRKHSNTKEE